MAHCEEATYKLIFATSPEIDDYESKYDFLTYMYRMKNQEKVHSCECAQVLLKYLYFHSNERPYENFFLVPRVSLYLAIDLINRLDTSKRDDWYKQAREVIVKILQEPRSCSSILVRAIPLNNSIEFAKLDPEMIKFMTQLLDHIKEDNFKYLFMNRENQQAYLQNLIQKEMNSSILADNTHNIKNFEFAFEQLFLNLSLIA